MLNELMLYRLDRKVLKATGTQSVYCNAVSKADALEKFKSNEVFSAVEEIEIEKLEPIRESNIINLTETDRETR